MAVTSCKYTLGLKSAIKSPRNLADTKFFLALRYRLHKSIYLFVGCVKINV